MPVGVGINRNRYGRILGNEQPGQQKDRPGLGELSSEKIRA
jgi:hypothetical protein